MTKEELNKIMNDPNNLYYGHGTGLSLPNPEIVNSIMNHGLRCSHGTLSFTSVALCFGNNVSDDIAKLMNNWPHKESKIIIIVSLPAKYNIYESSGIGTYDQANAAYYFTPSKEQQEKYRMTNSNYVMPEFIKGYYDANNGSFVPNPNYYELLPQEQQEKLFNQVKKNFIDIINNDHCGIEKYRLFCRDVLKTNFPLTNEDISVAKKNNCQEIVKMLGKYANNEEKIRVNNQDYSITNYIWQFVYPHLPADGIVIMKDGSIHLVDDFIENYILKDAVTKYQGDALKYILENTQNNLGVVNHTYETMVGEKSISIMATDMVDYIDEDLLNKNISLADGTTMTMRDYLVDVYAPYMPSNGKVLLKNGEYVTTKDFIENHLIQNGNLAYGGDIHQIMTNLTSPNNGFVTTDKKQLVERLEDIKSSFETVKKQKEEEKQQQQNNEYSDFDADFDPYDFGKIM